MLPKEESYNKVGNLYGLIGKNISYSFSKDYFTNKFEVLNLCNSRYINFDLPSIRAFEQIRNIKNIKGLNVTTPYKEAIIPYLDKVDKEALKIGAINTIVFKNRLLKGYNTDHYGFEYSLLPLLKDYRYHALILGTGGASKAVAYVLKKLGISFLFVSRDPATNQISYKELNRNILENHRLIINCSPLGTFPKTTKKPLIPYRYITRQHILYDLIYNPAKTAFLKEGEKRGATIKNGFEMLQIQAEWSWKLWKET